MTDIENKVERLDGRVSFLEQHVTETTTNVNSLIRELKDFKTEMRDRDNQRAAEIIALRQKHDADIKEMNQRFYQKFDDMNQKIDDKFDKLSSQIQNLTIAAIVGIGAIVLGGGAIVWSAITTLSR